MMSQTAPVNETHQSPGEISSGVRDNAFVSVYNDGDISEYLYITPAFASGFLPLEPQDDKQAHPIHIHQSKVRPAETFNTGTTPPPAATVEKKAPEQQNPPKPAMKNTPQQQANSMAKAVNRERRPSFIEVSTPTTHEHEQHKTHHIHRRHSSESHVPMSWWPENEETARHEWVERDGTSADEEEDVIEEEVWTDAFYE
ncbi:uncharacterized protein Z518_08535 [Rhinocladiella mackenziei CBS 650.93]|uniref:Uncharacterized protein n=1 Tax=Rhinocladiella mackenziei CBS 650.93 TaxID=1442369 RepID=A0A0D2I9P7_9EURO|nr:uncharacterized protein Z518_08535 [Rhinocladiella mackenziei CBS 650.93]KIX02594.1 hypothetical protein Z518_08535 [Rhinocladiella mackenziei CBS 650.93]